MEETCFFKMLSNSNGLYLLTLFSVLVFASLVPGFGWSPKLDCGQCLIQSHPNQECEITGIASKFDPRYQLPRSRCYITRPQLNVSVAPFKDCSGLTFNISIRIPDEGRDCLTGLRVTIKEHMHHKFMYGYDIQLKEGKWSLLDEGAVLHFQVPDRTKTSCAPHLYPGLEYFIKVQTVPMRQVLVKSIPVDSFDSTRVHMSVWAPGKWQTKVKYETFASGVTVWFEDLPPQPVCLCLRRYQFLLIKQITSTMKNLQIGEPLVVTYPQKEGFFSDIEDGRYRICVEPLEHDDECQGGCRVSCSDWFDYRHKPVATRTSGLYGVGSVPVPVDSWISPTVGVTCSIAVVLMLIAVGLLTYKRYRKIEPKLVVIIHHAMTRTAKSNISVLMNRINVDKTFHSIPINMTNLQLPPLRICLRTFLFKYRQRLINLSKVIVIVCSDVTGDNFLSTQAWPSDREHQKVLSLICDTRNREKLALVKWNTNTDVSLLQWMKFSGGTMPLTNDTDGAEFLNGIKSVKYEAGTSTSGESGELSASLQRFQNWMTSCRYLPSDSEGEQDILFDHASQESGLLAAEVNVDSSREGELQT